jgi:hypothetical protein
MVHTQLTMTRLRRSIFHIYQTAFTREERAAFELWEKPPTFNHTPEFIYGLLVAHVIAVVAAVYLIWTGLATAGLTGKT